MFWVQVRGEEIEAEFTASPAPARSPPKVVEAVPPRRTAIVPLAERTPVPSVTRMPFVIEENLTVLVAKIVPKKGEEEALKAWSVPAETIARGPPAVKV